MTSYAAPILVAGDSTADADLVRKLLAHVFTRLAVSTASEDYVADFERHLPEVLILAFNGLEKARGYYMGLCRLSKIAANHPHRTLILCNKTDAKTAYELCCLEHFDDYLLFWPMTLDGARLPMSVLLAARAMQAQREQTQLAAYVRQVKHLQAQLDLQLTQGLQHTARAQASLMQAEVGVGDAMSDFAQAMLSGEMKAAVTVQDPELLRQAFTELMAVGLGVPLQQARGVLLPVDDWLDGVKSTIEQLRPSDSPPTPPPARPTILLVDDDGFQHKLVSHLLADLNCELACASSGIEAIALFKQKQPCLVLMDVMMPDITGIDLTRYLKSMPNGAAVPIVMVTGNSDKEILAQSLQAGAADFLVKPFKRVVLHKKVLRFLG
ncbi:response regulator [Malikia sp.]|uniref:response regulator n=1 Tax=Malikia sp. TaxID=2070706 RepID=UPI002630B8B1|nr:response regulator [Malikia sp.]MDD2729778.1 response regulator [Malikia sp.]